MNAQITIDQWIAANPPAIHGDTYQPNHDKRRLKGQFMKVFNLMKDGQWRSLQEIRAVVGGTDSALSARLRGFRNPKNGGHTVISRRRGDNSRGEFEYRLIPRF